MKAFFVVVLVLFVLDRVYDLFSVRTLNKAEECTHEDIETIKRYIDEGKKGTVKYYVIYSLYTLLDLAIVAGLLAAIILV